VGRAGTSFVATAGVIVFLAGAILARPAVAQESTVSSIDVRANPELVRLGGRVTISGRSGLDHKTSRTVKISVQGFDGTREQLTAEADTTGDFKIDYAPPGDGKHIVEVISPGGKDRGETTFFVVGQTDMEEEVKTEQKAVIRTAQDAADLLSELLAKLPASPAKDDVNEKLAPLKETLARLAAESGKLGPMMRALDGVVRQSPGFGAVVYTSVFTPLGEWHKKAGVERRRIDAELARSRQANVRCDSLHQVTEVLNFLSFMMGLADKPFGILVGFAKDYDSKKLSALEKDPAKAAVIASAVKSIPELAGGVMGLFKIATGIATDIAGYMAQQYFAKYCEKFEGPVTGTMDAEYLKDGVAWRKWTQRLSGRLTVRYAKPDNNGDAVRVTGEFVGRLVGLAHWDDAMPILFKKLEGTYQQFRRTIIPKINAAGAAVGDGAKAAVLDLADGQGQVANALGPGGFRIPIEGELVDRKLTLRVLPATIDITDMSVKVISFIGSPLFLGFINTGYELEVSKAHHMISAALGVFGPQEPVELTVIVDAKKKVMTIDRQFKATRGRRTGKAYGSYTLTLKLSNPPS
jgi:hypothetical protein